MQISRMITAVDAHACGEPGRTITAGVLDVPGDTMFDKRLYFEKHAIALRKRMLREPCGYPAAKCNLILSADPTRIRCRFCNYGAKETEQRRVRGLLQGEGIATPRLASYLPPP